MIRQVGSMIFLTNWIDIGVRKDRVEKVSRCTIDLIKNSLSTLNKSKLLILGLNNETPRLRNILKGTEKLKKNNKDIDFKIFQELIMFCYAFFRRIIQNNLNIRDLGGFQSKENEIYNSTKEADLEGFIPICHSRLQKANEDRFAVSICTLEGQRINFGNSESYVCMHQLSAT